MLDTTATKQLVYQPPGGRLFRDSKPDQNLTQATNALVDTR